MKTNYCPSLELTLTHSKGLTPTRKLSRTNTRKAKKKEHVEDKQTQINIAVTKEVQIFIRFI